MLNSNMKVAKAPKSLFFVYLFTFVVSAVLLSLNYLADSQNSLGYLYNHGYGFKTDFEQAVNYYRLAAEQGNDWGQFNLGLMYMNGDGIDSDFSTGLIRNSLFSNIGGDAIDFSGSKSKVHNAKFLNIKDKAISAGENSLIDLKNLKINNTGVGIASKDGSITELDNAVISDYKLSALMTYNKKSFYKYPKLISLGVKYDDSTNALISQTNSHLSVNGIQILEKDIDVKKLYETDIMKK